MLSLVLVTYNPEFSVLESLVSRLRGCADFFVVVDNASRSPQEIATLLRRLSVNFLMNRENFGLAKAQNIGIEYARQLGADQVLILDQDSSLISNDILLLRQTLSELSNLNLPIAAVGPHYTEGNTGKIMPLPRLGNFSMRSGNTDQTTSADDAPIPDVASVDYVISSGALIPMTALDAIGVMDDKLFIDLVDVEWGLRAASKGFRSYVALKVTARHTIGNGLLMIFNRPIVLHQPIRNYFWVRNAVALIHRSYVPLAWRLFLLRRIVLHSAVYPLLGDRKWLRLQYVALGAWHGITGQWRSPPT